MAEQKGAAPPGRGRMDHEVMDSGVEAALPGRANGRSERFPGEREADTAMPSQPGIIGTTGYGGDLPATTEDATVNEDMAREKANEGGGHAGLR